ncbi:hypothetical protein MUK70_15170 [Dyadobacter chenwenxiniae]|uniref:Tetratricopeptide repeat protein n=1 Tax=Dyadobacter chenwenxiniae TaxID=2906456 RepID=A0A9X1TJX0_9BACT|nr:hypothetical protein [Dyadobacter chenwenxiniae]MCF0060583.1 hypothetical protein [Dyadobacter chenwenxiniae]UON86314.1 hypothetical protein MUK70_15170 [Dyadobacter chenwenxiniae]
MENLSREDIKQIHLYLHHLMEPEEREQFELKIKSDKAFADEVEIQRIAQMYRFTKIKDHLAGLRDEMIANGQLSDEKESLPLKELPLLGRKADINSETNVISLWPKRLAAAALIIAMLGFGTWYWYNQNNTGDEIADGIKKEQKKDKVTPISPTAEDMVAVFIGEASQPRENVPPNFKKAVGAFENQKTDEAIRMLLDKNISQPPKGSKGEYGASQKGPKADPVLESYRKFYLGISYLSKGEPAKALTYLRQVKAPLKDEGRWYMALAYLKNSEPAKARPLLRSINSDRSSKHVDEAAQLLRELK